ncbi:hypothetical protein ACTXPA_17505, partial [Glutamicibacter arilaitensis]|uniref:hypothetical protein n=1 Tax=Glutamicibacter arilaitensis TaxID=256701 RepID=UPI003FD42E39
MTEGKYRSSHREKGLISRENPFSTVLTPCFSTGLCITVWMMDRIGADVVQKTTFREPGNGFLVTKIAFKRKWGAL